MECEAFVWMVLGTAGSALWEFTARLLVPLTAAGVAAGLVIHQIRRGDAQRAEERRGAGIQAASELLIKTGTWAAGAGPTPAIRMEGNLLVVKMHSHLTGADRPVGQWVARTNAGLTRKYEAWEASIREQAKTDLAGAELRTKTVGPERAEIGRQCAEALQVLLDWQVGERPTSWFVENMPELGAH
ncbi:hypothetical protein [Herbiconiux liangxiaofengii]|uniref:hypothetical protein n=1 Tax=Herbiconiux liangxiaofengii TaxID=3342795 RepID=UPI0035B97AB0